MNDFFTAKEAKERSKSISNAKLEKELKHIYGRMNDAIQLGMTSYTFIDEKISEQAKEFLLNKGFKVSWFEGDQRDPCNDTIVSWE